MTSKIKVRGTATNVKWYPKEEKSTFNVLTFNVQEIDDTGNHLRLVPVTFKLTEYTNVVEDGQEVEVIGIMGRERILLAEKVINLKTNAEVSSDVSTVQWAMIFAAVSGVIGMLITFLSSNPNYMFFGIFTGIICLIVGQVLIALKRGR